METPATLASIAGGTIEVGEKFRDSRALKVKVERVFLAQGRRCRLDKRVSGGQGKLIRCSGAIIADGVKGATGCQARVRAYNERSTNEWNTTEAVQGCRSFVFGCTFVCWAFFLFFNGAWKVVASFVVFGFIAFVLCGTATSWPQLSALANTGCPCSCFFPADAVSLRSKPVQV